MASDTRKTSGWVREVCLECDRLVDPRLSEECDLLPGYCSEQCEVNGKRSHKIISMEDVDRQYGPEDIDDRFDRQRDEAFEQGDD